MTRSIMFESTVPTHYWPEAIVTSVYLMNRLPTRILDMDTPLNILSQKTQLSPTLTLPPKVFGTTVYVHIPKATRTKFDPCAIKCIFVGYATHQKGYRCFHPPTNRMYVSMDCDFVETEFYYSQPLKNQGEIRDRDDFLSWLTFSPTEETQNPETTTEQTTEPGPPPNEAPVLEDNTEVLNLHSSGDVMSGHFSTDILSSNDEQVQSSGDEPARENPDTEIQVVAPRYNLRNDGRGIPKRQYSPVHLPRQSRYPISNLVRGSVSSQANSFAVTLASEDIPRNAKEAQKKREWKQAMDEELQALEKNNTWELCNLPPGKKPVGYKWVFTIKYKADGTIDRYKARLVAKGYTQTYGIDYSETFSPVAKINTIRVLFAVAANKDWPLHQFDVKNAFLHGDLKEEVYMVNPTGTDRVCRLKKALYGLKQSPRAWFGRFTVAMKENGYRQSNADHTLFLKRRGDKITCLIIYVDDMILTGNDDEEIQKLKGRLFSEFEMKDLGRLKYFLGIEVLRSTKGIFISQRKYILDLLAETGMVDCKPAETPIVVNHGLQITADGKPANQSQYQRLVGKLIYLSHTRPDIAYAVGVVSQFMHQPQEDHMEAAMRIVRYLKGTAGKGVFFRKTGNLEVMAYTDADWAGNPNDRRSTSGYFTMIGGSLVTWKSKKQHVVALSSAEAEFRGISRGITEILWIRKLMRDLGFPPQQACKIFCDNKAAISISENPVQHDRTKHVEVDRHFIKEKLEDGQIELPFTRSEDQLADILTKAVNTRSFITALSKLGIGDPTTQLEGEC